MKKKFFTLIQWIRSIAFLFCLYGGTLILFIVFTPTLFMSRKKALCFPIFWSTVMPKILAGVCGVKLRIKGLENLPKESGYIIASKHQSAMETIVFHATVPNIFYILKKELLFLPIAGLYFLKSGCVAIDRSGGAKTMRKMLTAVQERLKEGMNLVIFPEGTRTQPGTKIPYKPGVALLYEQCRMPVVPVALNTGFCWPKNKTLKKSGTVTIEFLPPIMPGLDKRAFLAELENKIETAQEALPNPFEKEGNA